jgi:hypothetical protein
MRAQAGGGGQVGGFTGRVQSVRITPRCRGVARKISICYMMKLGSDEQQ